MKTKITKMTEKQFKNDPMWTDSIEEIAKFRNIIVESIERYLKSHDGKGGLVLGIDEKKTTWFRLEKPKGAGRGRPRKVISNDNEEIKEAKKIPMSQFLIEFGEVYPGDDDKIKGLIADGLINSEMVGSIRIILYKDYSTTMAEIAKNKKRLAKETEKKILEEQEDELGRMDPNEPEIELPVLLVEWIKFISTIKHPRMKAALSDGFFENVDKELFHTKDTGKNQVSWEVEWPGKLLANKLGKLIMRGGRDPIMMSKAITKLLLDHNYKGMGEKPGTEENLDEIDQDIMPSEELREFKKLVKNKIDTMEKFLVDEINKVAEIARSAHAIAKQNQMNISHLQSRPSSKSTNQKTPVELIAGAISDPEWEKI